MEKRKGEKPKRREDDFVLTKMGQINSISVIARERDDREDQKIHPNRAKR